MSMSGVDNLFPRNINFHNFYPRSFECDVGDVMCLLRFDGYAMQVTTFSYALRGLWNNI
jgi:hypothetical protein